jgi:hypothetical protein
MVVLPRMCFRQEVSEKGSDNLENDYICIFFHWDKETVIHIPTLS